MFITDLSVYTTMFITDLSVYTTMFITDLSAIFYHRLVSLYNNVYPELSVYTTMFITELSVYMFIIMLNHNFILQCLSQSLQTKHLSQNKSLQTSYWQP